MIGMPWETRESKSFLFLARNQINCNKLMKSWVSILDAAMVQICTRKSRISFWEKAKQKNFTAIKKKSRIEIVGSVSLKDTRRKHGLLYFLLHRFQMWSIQKEVRLGHMKDLCVIDFTEHNDLIVFQPETSVISFGLACYYSLKGHSLIWYLHSLSLESNTLQVMCQPFLLEDIFVFLSRLSDKTNVKAV